MLDHHGPLHLEIAAFFGRQFVTDRVGDGERFVGPAARRDDRHEGARQLRDTSAVVELLAHRDRRAEVLLGVRESVELTLGKGLRPESDQAGETRDVLAFEDAAGRVRGIRTANSWRDRERSERSRERGVIENVGHVRQYCRYHDPVSSAHHR